MSRHTFERLDLTDPAVRRDYEEGFFTSFARVQSNQLVRSLWMWDFASRRVRTRIPYEDQWVFGARNAQGGVEAALAFNVAMTKFQASAYGFEAPAQTQGCFEVLTFFNPQDREVGFKFRLWSECLRVLAAQGFHTGYATTAPRPLKLYRRIGWQVQQERQIQGEQRFFLQYRIASVQPSSSIMPSASSRV